MVGDCSFGSLCAKNNIRRCVTSGLSLGSVKIILFSEKNYSGKSDLEQEKNTKRLRLTKLVSVTVLVLTRARQRGVLLGESFQSRTPVRASAAPSGSRAARDPLPVTAQTVQARVRWGALESMSP